MAMLHIVNKSPFERNTLESCLRLAQNKGTVLLIEDAAIAADKRTRFKEIIEKAQGNLKFCVLMGDASARGIAQDCLIEGIEPIDYDGFVDLVTSHDTVQSWV